MRAVYGLQVRPYQLQRHERGRHVELVPNERAVLTQVLDLFLEASVRVHRFKKLSSHWPQAHYDAFRAGFDGLVEKGFIAKSADEHLFSITNAGMKAFLQLETAEAQ